MEVSGTTVGDGGTRDPENAGDNQGDTQEQSYQMLLKWTQSQGEGSYQTLGDAIRTIFGEKLYSKYVKIVLNSEECPILTPHTQ